MADREHRYQIELRWTGNLGSGTESYRGYSRDHEVVIAQKPSALPGSADRTFRGDPSRYNPEELLVSALSQCHLLAYLHLCAVNQVVVTDYLDQAGGVMITGPDGSGRFREVTLSPQVTITAESDPDTAARLHDEAHTACFIANSVNFPVRHRPRILIAD